MKRHILAAVAVALAAGVLYADDPPQTFTIGGWGSKASGSNVGSLLGANFAALYPNGVSVGVAGDSGFSMTFTSLEAVRAYLRSMDSKGGGFPHPRGGK